MINGIFVSKHNKDLKITGMITLQQHSQIINEERANFTKKFVRNQKHKAFDQYILTNKVN